MKVVSTKTINVQFKVWCPTLNRVTHRLLLLGAPPELGAWNILKAPLAYPTSDLHVWTVHVCLPAECQFEWTWVKTKYNRTGAEWERPTPRHRHFDCFSGQLHTIWGEPEEVFVQSASCLEISTFRQVEEGHALLLSGSTPTTGLWDIEGAVRAQEFPKKSGYWKVSVTVDGFCTLDFKWTIVSEKNPSAVVVQEQQPHSVFCRPGWLRLVAPWGVPGEVVVETSVINEQPDSALGRTDVLVREKQRRLKEIKEWEAVGKGSTPGPGPAPRPTSLRPPGLPQKADVDDVSPDFPRATTSAMAGLGGETQATPTSRRVPTVLRVADLNEHSRYRQTAMSKNERLTNQLSKNYLASFPSATQLKGSGQVGPSENVSTDVSHQVPISEGGVVLSQLAREAANTSKSKPNPKGEREVEGGPGGNGTATTKAPGPPPKEELAQIQTSSKGKQLAIITKTDDCLLKELKNMSSMLDTMDQASTHERDGIPVIQRNVAEVSSGLSPTWSMLVERDVEETRNPVILPNKKPNKVNVTTKIQQAPPPVTRAVMQKAATLFDKLKEGRERRPNSKSASPAQSMGAIPSVIGEDDMMKTIDDLVEEEENRRMWELKRSQGSPVDLTYTESRSGTASGSTEKKQGKGPKS